MSMASYFGEKTDFLTVMLGGKGTGKTHNLIHFMETFEELQRFREIHIVAPHFKDEQNGSYAPLMAFKTPVFVYPEFTAKIGGKLKEIQSRPENADSSILLVVDDGTNQNLFRDRSLVGLATTSRHCRISSILVIHGDKNVIPPIIRQNADFIFIFYCSTKLLKSLYEEHISRFPDFKNYNDFDAKFKERVDKVQYNGMFLNNRLRSYSFNMKYWFPKE